MAKPGRTGAYANQSSAEVGDPIAFNLDDGNWTDSPTEFEVDTLPPGFTTNGQSLAGAAGCKMVYIIFVRGVNAEGFGDWFPLQWIVSTASATARTLYGLPVAWPALPQHPLGTPAVVYIKRATLGGAQSSSGSGVLIVNDIAIDESASPYDASFLRSQLLLNGVGNTFLRATVPGWEIIIDTNG